MSANGFTNVTDQAGDDLFGGYGYLTVGSLENDGAGVSDPSFPYLANFINPIHPAADTYRTVEQYVELILSDNADPTQNILPHLVNPTKPSETDITWIQLIDRNMNFRV
jgi:hypothetical protein